MNNLINRNILVTGSNKGIGKELAIGLGSQGANIILLGRNSTGLEEVYDVIQKSKNTSPMIIECDLENLDEKQEKRKKERPKEKRRYCVLRQEWLPTKVKDRIV